MTKLGPLTSIDRTYVGLPPWLYAPKDALMLERFGSVIVGGASSAEVAAFDVPDNLHLVIRKAGFSSRDGMGTMLASWTVKAGGEPIAGYHHIRASIGSFDSPGEVTIVVPGRKRVTIEVENGAYITSYTFTARFAGWLYRPDPREVVSE